MEAGLSCREKFSSFLLSPAWHTQVPHSGLSPSGSQSVPSDLPDATHSLLPHGGDLSSLPSAACCLLPGDSVVTQARAVFK